MKYLVYLMIFSACFARLNAFKAEKNDKILSAMRDELKRSMNELQLESVKKPYYIEYSLTLTNPCEISSTMGSLKNSDCASRARINVGVRVGDYKFDNSNFFDFGLSLFGSNDDEENFSNRSISPEPDYENIRRELWLATDAAYKRAVEIYSKKEASLKNKLRNDTTWDFLPEKPNKTYDIEPTPKFNQKNFEGLANQISSIFLNYPGIYTSDVSIEFQPEITYYVNSEGMEYVRTDCFTGLEVVAFTQSDDGMPLGDYFSSYRKDPANFPASDSLIKATIALCDKLIALKNAPKLEETYSGPVLFTGQAAAELFAQNFAPNLVTQRQQLSETNFRTGDRFSSFQNKIGGRVLPEFLSIVDDPYKTAFGGTQLVGAYKLDDDGLSAEKVDLVDKGYLKALVSGRVPTRRIRSSNGHARNGAPMFSVLTMSTDKTNTLDQMKAKMLELVKNRELPYGIVVTKVMNQNVLLTSLYRTSMGKVRFARGDGMLNIIEAWKVYPNGKMELIRGCDGAGIAAASFKDIIESSKPYYALNYLASSVVPSFVSGGSPYVACSVITGDLLFEDMEIRSVDEDLPKLPIATNPLTIK